MQFGTPKNKLLYARVYEDGELFWVSWQDNQWHFYSPGNHSLTDPVYYYYDFKSKTFLSRSGWPTIKEFVLGSKPFKERLLVGHYYQDSILSDASFKFNYFQNYLINWKLKLDSVDGAAINDVTINACASLKGSSTFILFIFFNSYLYRPQLKMPNLISLILKPLTTQDSLPQETWVQIRQAEFYKYYETFKWLQRTVKHYSSKPEEVGYLRAIMGHMLVLEEADSVFFTKSHERMLFREPIKNFLRFLDQRGATWTQYEDIYVKGKLSLAHFHSCMVFCPTQTILGFACVPKDESFWSLPTIRQYQKFIVKPSTVRLLHSLLSRRNLSPNDFAELEEINKRRRKLGLNLLTNGLAWNDLTTREQRFYKQLFKNGVVYARRVNTNPRPYDYRAGIPNYESN